MSVNSSKSDEEGGWSKLRAVQAARRVRLFRAEFQLIFILIISITTVSLIKLNIILDFPTFLQLKISEFAVVIATLSLIGFIANSVALQLELGESVDDWLAAFQLEREILDAQKAKVLETNERIGDGLHQLSASSAALEENIDSVQGITSELKGLFDESRAHRDLVEFERWTADNYPRLAKAICERLQQEILLQGARANVNLSIALAVAFIGIAILSWLAVSSSQILNQGLNLGDRLGILYFGAFISKFLLAVGANIFAFFFLSTYRRNLSEIRYFHNELTNIQSKIFAVYISIEKNANSSMNNSLKQLSVTERNFILKKGESTTDLNLKGLDSSDVNSLMSLMKEMSAVVKKH